eukprot:gb/GECG01004918.1/.p1 GENE.gb/GECG01004918.1/~~gb/GECG01004918.1/.p1  ORF type:complete len:930 (+),score=84.73 gb/GECG01004918.1/:1-2790(+)
MMMIHAMLVGFFIILMQLSGETGASHYRYGVVTWRFQPNQPDYTVQFTVNLAWRWSFFGQPRSGTVDSCGNCFHYGDGTSGAAPPLSIDSISEEDDWFAGEGKVMHMYSDRTNGREPFRWRFEGCCRIGSIQNSGSSGWRLIADVDLSRRADTGTANNPPSSSMMPIVTITEGVGNTFFVVASDADNDPLSFRLANGEEMSNDGTGTQPPGIFIDEESGQVTWDNPSISSGHESAWWYTNIIVSDGYSSVGIDFIVRVEAQATICTAQTGDTCVDCGNPCTSDTDCGNGCHCGNNRPPKFVSPPWTDASGLPQCFLPGQVGEFLVTAADDEPCHTVTLQTAGRPSGSTFEKISSVANPVEYRFQWSPAVDESGSQQMSIVALDEEDSSPPQTVELFVPSTNQLPDVDTLTPLQGPWNEEITVDMFGNGFILSVALACRYRLIGSSDWITRKAIFVSTGHIKCHIPKRSALTEHTTDEASMSVEIEVSNTAGCASWKSISTLFEYTGPTPTPSPTASVSKTPHATSSPTNSETPSGTRSMSATPTVTTSVTCSSTGTSRPTEETPTKSDSPSTSPMITKTPSSESATFSSSRSATQTMTTSGSNSMTRTPSPSESMTCSVTSSVTGTPTASGTQTSTGSLSRTPSASETGTTSRTPSASNTLSSTPAPSESGTTTTSITASATSSHSESATTASSISTSATSHSLVSMSPCSTPGTSSSMQVPMTSCPVRASENHTVSRLPFPSNSPVPTSSPKKTSSATGIHQQTLSIPMPSTSATGIPTSEETSESDGRPSPTSDATPSANPPPDGDPGGDTTVDEGEGDSSGAIIAAPLSSLLFLLFVAMTVILYRRYGSSRYSTTDTDKILPSDMDMEVHITHDKWRQAVNSSSFSLANVPASASYRSSTRHKGTRRVVPHRNGRKRGRYGAIHRK